MTNDAYLANSLFEEPYWLDAVAPAAWSSVEVKRDGRVMGRLPFVFKRRFGFTAVSTPSYTPWLGPWICQSKARGSSQLSHQHEILGELVAALPRASRSLIACAPEVTNLMALHWAGYSLQVAYTYRLHGLDAPDTIWRGLRDKTRNICRKAEKLTAINTERTIADILPVLDKTFRRQGVDFSNRNGVLERIDATMSARGQRTIYCAEDAQGRIHAFVYVVFDERHCFYLAGGGDPELRNSGAHALAMWHAIKNAGKHSKIFDFEGSMIPAIEHFVRGFGPVLTPRYAGRKNSPLLQMADAGSRLISSLCQMTLQRKTG